MRQLSARGNCMLRSLPLASILEISIIALLTTAFPVVSSSPHSGTHQDPHIPPSPPCMLAAAYSPSLLPAHRLHLTSNSTPCYQPLPSATQLPARPSTGPEPPLDTLPHPALYPRAHAKLPRLCLYSILHHLRPHFTPYYLSSSAHTKKIPPPS